MTLSNFRKLLLETGIPVFHYEGELESGPYIVYQEYATTYVFASNKAYTEKTSVSVNHYTKIEFDQSFDLLKKILLNRGIFFSIVTTYDKIDKTIQNQLEVILIEEYGGGV